MSESFYNSDKINKIFSYIDLLKDNSNAGDILAIDGDKNPYWTTIEDNSEIITYGDTSVTYNDVAAKVAEGKILFAHYTSSTDDITLPYVCTTALNQHVFTNMVGNKRWNITLDNQNVWGTSSDTLAKLDSPTFTGTPTAPTATAGTDTTQIATTAFTKTEITNSKKNLVVDTVTVSNLAQLTTALNTWVATLENKSVGFYYISTSATFLPFTDSSNYLVRLRRVTDTVQVATMWRAIGTSTTIQHRYDGISELEMTCRSGTWYGPEQPRATVGNYFDYSTRPTDLNTAIPFEQYDGRLTQFKVSGNNVANKPMSNGHVLNLAWDYENNYTTQLYLPIIPANGESFISVNRKPQIRGCSNGTWRDWETIALESAVPGLVSELVSYDGDGTSGSEHPNSVTFSFAPRIVRMLGRLDSGVWKDTNEYGLLLTSTLTTTYTASRPFAYNSNNSSNTNSYAKKSSDGKTISWYYNSTSSTAAVASYQRNSSDSTYYVLGIF